jgi:hypothetical protein
LEEVNDDTDKEGRVPFPMVESAATLLASLQALHKKTSRWASRRATSSPRPIGPSVCLWLPARRSIFKSATEGKSAALLCSNKAALLCSNKVEKMKRCASSI